MNILIVIEILIVILIIFFVFNGFINTDFKKLDEYELSDIEKQNFNLAAESGFRESYEDMSKYNIVVENIMLSENQKIMKANISLTWQELNAAVTYEVLYNFEDGKWKAVEKEEVKIK